MPEFQFKYFTATNVVSIDDFNVNTKTGPFVKRNFPFQNIVHFYYQQLQNHHQIYIVYLDDKGKRKKIALMATPGEPGMQNLNYYLLEKIPAKSVNHLKEKEAFKVMQVSNPKNLALMIVGVVILAIFLGMLYPGLAHYFDFGFQNVKVEDIIAGKDIGTKNVGVEGRVLNYGIEETVTTTKNGVSTTSHSTFVPIVGENWKKGDKIDVVMSFSELNDAEYDLVLQNKNFKGVIRNVWWEGLSDKQMGYFHEHYNLNMPEKPLLIEFTDQEHNDQTNFYVFIGVAVFSLLLIIIAAVKMKS